MTQWKDNTKNTGPLLYNAVAAQQGDLVLAVTTSHVEFRLTGQVTIAGGTTSGNLLTEGLLRLIRWIRILEGGKPTIEWDSRALVQLYNRFHKHPATVVTLANAGIQGPTSVEADFHLDLADPLIFNKQEVGYRPVSDTAKFQVEVEWEPNPKSVMADATNDRVWTFANFQLEVCQHYDSVTALRPVYVPRLRRLNSPNINGVTLDFNFDLQMSARSRGLLIHTLSDGATDPTVITGNLTLEGAVPLWSKRDPVMMYEADYAHFTGMDRNNLGAYFFVDFLDPAVNGGGEKLSNAYDPTQIPQLRLRADVNKGAGAVGIIRVYDQQLAGIAGVTRPLAAGHALR